MPSAPLDEPSEQVTRDFAVAAFVVHDGRVLLHWHAKLERWLPPGGHIEPNELPDEAVIREVWEETGVAAVLLDAPEADPNLPQPGVPRPLARPAGIVLTAISPGHQHIDLVYFATGEPVAPREGVDWFGPDELPALGLTAEITDWCAAVLAAVPAGVVSRRG
jgi:8-oxo-dGTP pyrophosphatase MutT (NUDIX family)